MTRVLMLALALLAHAQDERAQKLPEPIQELRDLALAAPPELGADVLIELAAAPGLERSWKIEFLQEAFRLAPRAKHPYRVTAAVGEAGHTDSDAGVLTRALGPGLSTLDLQMRSIQAMLTLDPAEARKMAEMLGFLRLPELSCSDALRPNVGSYDAMLREMFDKGFSAAEKQRGTHVQWLESHLRAVSSPMQLEPAARILFETNLPPANFGRLVNAYAAAVKQMRADDRSFTSSTTDGLTQTFHSLDKALQKAAVSSQGVTDCYRTYHVSHLTSARCVDTADLGKGLARTVTLFNSSLLQMAKAGTPEVRPISDDEMKPSRLIDERAKVYHFWQTETSKPLLATMRRLRFGSEEQQEQLTRISQCAPTAQIASGGRSHPCSCR